MSLSLYFLEPTSGAYKPITKELIPVIVNSNANNVTILKIQNNSKSFCRNIKVTMTYNADDCLLQGSILGTFNISSAISNFVDCSNVQLFYEDEVGYGGSVFLYFRLSASSLFKPIDMVANIDYVESDITLEGIDLLYNFASNNNKPDFCAEIPYSAPEEVSPLLLKYHSNGMVNITGIDNSYSVSPSAFNNIYIKLVSIENENDGKDKILFQHFDLSDNPVGTVGINSNYKLFVSDNNKTYTINYQLYPGIEYNIGIGFSATECKANINGTFITAIDSSALSELDAIYSSSIYIYRLATYDNVSIHSEAKMQSILEVF